MKAKLQEERMTRAKDEKLKVQFKKNLRASAKGAVAASVAA